MTRESFLRGFGVALVLGVLGGGARAQYIINTVAGGGPPDGAAATSVAFGDPSVAVDAAGNLYIAAFAQYRVPSKVSRWIGPGMSTWPTKAPIASAC